MCVAFALIGDSPRPLLVASTGEPVTHAGRHTPEAPRKTVRAAVVEFNRFEDIDPQETQEWLESIDSVLRSHGTDRALERRNEAYIR
jgi:hypothetical protein